MTDEYDDRAEAGTSSFLRKWINVVYISQSLLETARQGEWERLVKQEIAYLLETEAATTVTVPDELTEVELTIFSGIVSRILENEQVLHRLLQARLQTLS
ncbi:hypothetical protein DLB95_22900 [Salmonella enterica subsp. diarizonae]|uniref:Flagellar protein FliT n=1 Tax=Salmonella diarizonae TaxID=59204 RepID=A0A5Y3W7W9_SALDZ|nr:hypothetical protein [Salmonella enterica subsp. diarizonae]EBG1930930.1 hypothetical protein [Salmonella enterica]EBS2926435.1 hypothetical protein [Salmonella enterica subsp. enterica serovar Hvittingfoss]ECJ4379992.1 hypothetical protein [Salmonella enterica subsp. diarizonae]HEB6459241.1 flagellar protein FliT [Salmonella enterica subsp. enterica serovar Hvittingfoss]